jgi:hypothetical protein
MAQPSQAAAWGLQRRLDAPCTVRTVYPHHPGAVTIKVIRTCNGTRTVTKIDAFIWTY